MPLPARVFPILSRLPRYRLLISVLQSHAIDDFIEAIYLFHSTATFRDACATFPASSPAMQEPVSLVTSYTISATLMRRTPSPRCFTDACHARLRRFIDWPIDAGASGRRAPADSYVRRASFHFRFLIELRIIAAPMRQHHCRITSCSRYYQR
jgi:hypothetical protein